MGHVLIDSVIYPDLEHVSVPARALLGTLVCLGISVLQVVLGDLSQPLTVVSKAFDARVGTAKHGRRNLGPLKKSRRWTRSRRWRG